MTFSTSTESPVPEGAPQRSGPQPNLNSNDPYAVLGVQRDTSTREIKRAYFALVREYPPESQPDAFKIIRAAYEKLRTADAKAETDLFLFQPPDDWAPRKRKPKLDLTVHTEDIWARMQQFGDLGRRDFLQDYRQPKL
jgi:curved DNA-binding protein CbpA